MFKHVKWLGSFFYYPASISTQSIKSAREIWHFDYVCEGFHAKKTGIYKSFVGILVQMHSRIKTASHAGGSFYA